VLAFVGTVVLGGHALLRAAGIDASPSALRETIAGFGLWSPLLYVSLLGLRHFLFLPSTLLLTLGGALFGVGLGTLAAAGGLLLAAMIEFGLVRVFKPRALMQQMERSRGGLAAVAQRGTPFLVFLGTAIPSFPATLLYGAAAVTKVSWTRFVAAVTPGAVIRGGTLTLLGAGLIEADWRLTTAAVLLIALGLAVTMRDPNLRSALLGARQIPDGPEAD